MAISRQRRWSAYAGFLFFWSFADHLQPIPSWVLPVETATSRAVWHSSEDMPALRRVIDQDTGQWVLEYAESSPLKTRVFYTEIDQKQVKGYDTLRFRWKLMADNTWVQVQVSGYPEPGREKRNYYLNKRPPIKNQWQEVWLDLKLDDDLGSGCKPLKANSG
ncbi:MAG: hypothetical protein NC911_10210 [Candidatus Omnitrophica bacterium]|nr:hypothetical protein [Candidatus Omnitrophota bacterium]